MSYLKLSNSFLRNHIPILYWYRAYVYLNHQDLKNCKMYFALTST